MPEPKGQLDISDVLADETSGEPSAARALKVLAMAREHGWVDNPHTSLVVRLTKDEALPFFIRWDLSFDPETGKKSWRFQGARAQNGQALNYNDALLYLQDPDVIHPEPPTSPEDDSDESFRTALGSLDPLGPTAYPVPKAAKPAVQADGWGALLA